METFFIKLAVAVIPLIILVTSVTVITSISHCHTHHPLSWHRSRRRILRSLAGGIMLR